MLDKLSQEVGGTIQLKISSGINFLSGCKVSSEASKRFHIDRGAHFETPLLWPANIQILCDTISQVCIALKTVKIRNAQHELIKQWPYKNQPMKHRLTHMYGNHLSSSKRKRHHFAYL